MPDLGIGEAIAAFMVTAGIGAETAGIAAPILLGATEGAAFGAGSAALTGGDPGQGALFGGITGGAGAGLGELAGGVGGGVGAAGVDTGATWADSLIPATQGTASGIIDAGAWDAISAGAGTFGSGAAPAAGSLGASAADTATALGGSPVSVAAPTTELAPGVSGTGAISTAPQTTLANVGGAVSGPSVGQAPVIGGAIASPDLTAGAGALGANPGADVFTGATAVTDAAPSATSAAADLGALPAGSPTPPIPPDIIPPAGNIAAWQTPNATWTPAAGEPGAFGVSQSTLQQIGGAISPVTHAAGDVISEAGSIVSSPLGKLAGAGISGLGLIQNMTAAKQTIPGMTQQNTIASTAANQGSQLSSYLTSGTLPPGVQSSIDQATQAAITAIKGRYASMGISADHSSVAQQEIAQAKQNAVTQGVSIAQSLLNSGTSLTNLSAQVYAQLVGENQAINNGVNQAVGNLSSALAGGNRITIGGTQAAA